MNYRIFLSILISGLILNGCTGKHDDTESIIVTDIRDDIDGRWDLYDFETGQRSVDGVNSIGIVHDSGKTQNNLSIESFNVDNRLDKGTGTLLGDEIEFTIIYKDENQYEERRIFIGTIDGKTIIGTWTNTKGGNGKFRADLNDSQIKINFHYLRYESYEDNDDNRFHSKMTATSYDDPLENAFLVGDIKFKTRFKDLEDQIIFDSYKEFFKESVLTGVWNAQTNQIDFSDPVDQTGYTLTFSKEIIPENGFESGEYVYELTDLVGDVITKSFYYPGLQTLPVPDSSLMKYAWQNEGDLKLIWTNPVGDYDQVAIVFTGPEKQHLLTLELPKDMESITIPKKWLAKLEVKHSVTWSLEMRSHSNEKMNMAAGISSGLDLLWNEFDLLSFFPVTIGSYWFYDLDTENQQRFIIERSNPFNGIQVVKLAYYNMENNQVVSQQGYQLLSYDDDYITIHARFENDEFFEYTPVEIKRRMKIGNDFTSGTYKTTLSAGDSLELDHGGHFDNCLQIKTNIPLFSGWWAPNIGPVRISDGVKYKELSSYKIKTPDVSGLWYLHDIKGYHNGSEAIPEQFEIIQAENQLNITIFYPRNEQSQIEGTIQAQYLDFPALNSTTDDDTPTDTYNIVSLNAGVINDVMLGSWKDSNDQRITFKAARDITGDWDFFLIGSQTGFDGYNQLDILQSKNQLSFSQGSGSLNGPNIELIFKDASHTIELSGRIEGETMLGTYAVNTGVLGTWSSVRSNIANWELFFKKSNDINESGPEKAAILQSGNDLWVSIYFEDQPGISGIGTVNGSEVKLTMNCAGCDNLTRIEAAGLVKGNDVTGDYTVGNGSSGTWRAVNKEIAYDISEDIINISGSWDLSRTRIGSETQESDRMEIVQTLDQLLVTIVNANGRTDIGSGTITNNEITISINYYVNTRLQKTTLSGSIIDDTLLFGKMFGTFANTEGYIGTWEAVRFLNPIDITGTWKIFNDVESDPQLIEIVQTGNTLLITTEDENGTQIINGSINGSDISFIIMNDDTITTVEGIVSGSTMSGTWTDNQDQSGTWSATKL